MLRGLKSATVALFATALVACGGDNKAVSTIAEPTPVSFNVAEIVRDSAQLSTLYTAVQSAGLDSTLADESSTFTVFAPTNAAFDALGEDTINALLADTETLTDILLYHVVAGSEINAGAAMSAAGTTVEMANGDAVGVSAMGSRVYINNAMVTVVDVEASNGVVHVIDTVLIPPADPDPATVDLTITELAINDPDFSTLVTALQAAGLADTLANAEGTFTVFAPTNEAFAKIPERLLTAILADTELLTQLLLQHVIVGAAVDSPTAYSLIGAQATMANDAMLDIALEDRMLTIGGATITDVDTYAANGIAHVIDTVIIGDLVLPEVTYNINEIVAMSDDHNTLQAALEATGLDAALDDDSATFTLFAPTDAAFAAVGEETINALLADTDALTDILLYHAIAAEIDSSAAIAAAGTTVAMVNGDSVGISVVEGKVYINNAMVTVVDIEAVNGVVHVIDMVLMPPAEPDAETMAMNIAEIAVASEGFSTLVAALTAANLVDTLADETATFTVFAPTDAAFAAIPSDTLNAILADADTLSAILLQHVIAGAAVDAVTAYSLNGNQAEMASGAMLDIAISEGQLTIGGAKVTTTDIYAANGIIHVIDAVIVGDVTLP
ncbi:MAG TPA: fasciclin domain-containing protein [Pseudomonadales bacterium]|nr:fasciclin domain-containing protein [Pseudomonadales bacterium]